MATTIQSKVENNNVARPAQKSMADWVKTMLPEITKALPKVITPERFTRITLSALSSNPKLAACTPKSFLGSMMTAAQLGLEVNTPLGLAYLIPYKNHGVDEAQFQIGYKGLIDLAYRSGEIETVQAHMVYENDTFTYAYGLEPKLEHIPALTDRGNATACYAMFKTKAGGYGFEVMSVAQIRDFAEKVSKSYSLASSPWQTNFEEMCKKTVLKKALKYAPLRTEFVTALAQDETIKTELSDDMFTVPDSTVIDADYSVAEATEDNADA